MGTPNSTGLAWEMDMEEGKHKEMEGKIGKRMKMK